MPLAEGVETEGEHATCVELGFKLGQGYLYGKPAVLTPVAQSLVLDLDNDPRESMQRSGV